MTRLERATRSPVRQAWGDVRVRFRSVACAVGGGACVLFRSGAGAVSGVVGHGRIRERGLARTVVFLSYEPVDEA